METIGRLVRLAEWKYKNIILSKPLLNVSTLHNSLVDINALKETHKWVQDVCTERDDDIIIVLVANIDLNNKR